MKEKMNGKRGGRLRNTNLENIKKLLSRPIYEEMKILVDKEKNGCSEKANPLDKKKITLRGNISNIFDQFF